MKLCWSAPERNKGPILEVLERVLPKQGTVLEIASGTGQHVIHFAQHLPALTFIPSDIDESNLESIRAWLAEAGLPNVLPPLRLDVTSEDWAAGEVNAIVNANMIHISPWECTEGLLAGAERYLSARGVLALYGPFRINGEHTAPSNAEFDADLKRRDARWGVREFEIVVALAHEHGLHFAERVAMPANNQTLVFRRD